MAAPNLNNYVTERGCILVWGFKEGLLSVYVADVTYTVLSFTHARPTTASRFVPIDDDYYY
jgi:hypothetical protein